MKARASRRAVSHLLATIILIAVVLSAGVAVYGTLSGWIGVYSSRVSVQVASLNLAVTGNEALLSVSVKNTGSKPLTGIVVTGYDDNGKPFKLALPPIEPGQTGSNTLRIPLGVSGLVLDGSGYNNHGTIHGATWVDGPYGEALSFDGVDDYVKVLNHPSLFPARISLEAWINPAKEHIYYEKIISMSRTASTFYYTYFLSYDVANHMRFQAYTTTSVAVIFSQSTMPVGVWTHVAGVYDGSKVYIYINGVLEASASLTGNLETSTKDLYLGAREDITQCFKGLIDEVRIYNRASDDEEVSFSNANPGLPPTRGLVAWYPLDEGSNAPYAFTVGNSYVFTITAYSPDGSVATQTVSAKAWT